MDYGAGDKLKALLVGSCLTLPNNCRGNVSQSANEKKDSEKLRNGSGPIQWAGGGTKTQTQAYLARPPMICTNIPPIFLAHLASYLR